MSENQYCEFISDGYRESELIWLEMLRDLKARELKIPPKLAIGDGALGFGAALGKEFPETKWQRCWVHKTANVLDKLPKGLQGKAKSMIHEMYMAESKEKALKAYRHFVEVYTDKYPKAVEWRICRTLHMGHTAAMELLQAGVDHAMIALWLGHESVETTQIYLEADLSLKEKLLESFAPVKVHRGRYIADDKLLSFLRAI